MKTISRTLFLIGALAAAGACKNNTEDAREAQETANKKAVEASEAQQEANEKAARAKRDADDRILSDHRDAEDKLRKDIESSDRKVADLRRKLNDAKGDVRRNADAAANEVELRHAKVDQNLNKLRTSAGAAWDSVKLELEADIAALNQAIDNFEDTLD
jgi:outer membrane lipopolysaccharide assembly protein LptE/RlpB